MTSIPAFKANLIQNVDNKQPAPSVEEILTSSGGQQYVPEAQPKNSHYILKTLGGLAVLTALGVTGRRGGFGKTVQKFLGGTPKLSPEQLQEQVQAKIQAKLNDYISRTEDALFEVKTLANGKTRASRNLADGKQEIILFEKDGELPEFRVILEKTGKNKGLNYTSYKGADILNEGFDPNAFYKQYLSTDIKKRWFFSRERYNNAAVTYGEMVRGDGVSTIERTTTYNKNGSVRRITDKDSLTPDVTVREMLYDKNDKSKLVGVDITTGDTTVRKIKGQAPVEL